MTIDANKNIEADAGYRDWLAYLKDKLRSVQTKAAVAVNHEMLQFYWELGADIVEKQKSASWGDRFLPLLSRDLSAEFPEMKGFSVSNLKYMRQWFLFYGGGSSIGQQPVGQIAQPPFPQIIQIPWDHNLTVIAKCKNLKPIGISDYELTRALPENLRSSLPMVEEIEAELGGDLG